MAGMRLFDISISDNSETMKLEGARDFGRDEPPFYLRNDADIWPMSLQDAQQLASAVRQLEWARARSTRHRPPARAYFQRKFSDGNGIELGFAVVGDVDQIYFQFADRRLDLNDQQWTLLYRSLIRFGEEVHTILEATARRRPGTRSSLSMCAKVAQKVRESRSTPSASPTLADVHAEVRELRAMIARLLPKPREWITCEEAARLVGRTPAAIRARCRVRPIGVKVDGTWRVDRVALLKGTP